MPGVRERETKCGGGGAGGVSRLRPRCSCWGLQRCTRSSRYLIWISQVSRTPLIYYLYSRCCNAQSRVMKGRGRGGREGERVVVACHHCLPLPNFFLLRAVGSRKRITGRRLIPLGRIVNFLGGCRLNFTLCFCSFNLGRAWRNFITRWCLCL